ncbi:MAG: hypothetical protein EA369_06995 [Bradymonadales bacterium]|nr:MAG: hypothetical protein EA369_06995 [Bradymonadales bacterium]
MHERVFEVEAPRSVCFGVVADVEAYPEFLGATKYAKRHGSGNDFEADFQIEVMKSLSYRLRFSVNEPEEIRWSFVSGEIIKDNRGYWRFHEISENKTRIEYGVEVKLGAFVPSAISKKLTESQLPALIRSFTKRMEEMAKKRGVANG